MKAAWANSTEKKTGQYHTPIPLAESLINHAFQTLAAGSAQVQSEQPEQLKILDPACGAGAFLWATYQHCLKTSQTITPQFYGLDQDPVSLALANALLDGHYQPMDSLSLYPDFQQASGLKGQMDWVIGNPPYVGEKNNKALFQQLLASHPGWKKHYQGKMDYWYFFLYLGLAALKPGGHLLFLTSRYWLTADGAKKLRETLLDQAEILEIIDFEETGWFADAVGHHSGAFLIKKWASEQDFLKTNRPLWAVASADSDSIHFESRLCEPQFKWHSGPWTAPVQDKWEDIFQKMKAQDTPFHEIFWDMQGIISGADHLTQNHLEKYPALKKAGHQVGEGIFCVSKNTHPQLFDAQLFDDRSCRPFLKPYFKGRHIQTQTLSSSDGQPSIQFPDQDLLLYLPHGLYTLPPDIILNHLEPYRPILEARREVQQGKIPWYALHWPRNEERLNGLSLVTPRRSPVNRFTLSPEGWFAHSDLTVLGLKDSPAPSESDYWPWLTLLNSPLLNAWMILKGKAKGKIREYYATPLRQIPLPTANAIQNCPFPMVNSSPEEAHLWVCQCYGLSNTEAQFVWDGWQAFKKV